MDLQDFAQKTSAKFLCKKLAKKRVRVNSSQGTCNIFAEIRIAVKVFCVATNDIKTALRSFNIIVATLRQRKTASHVNALCNFAQ